MEKECFSRKVRRLARWALRKNAGEMTLHTLAKQIQSPLGANIRRDFLSMALAVRGSGIESLPGGKIRLAQHFIDDQPHKEEAMRKKSAAKASANNGNGKKLTTEEFVIRAIDNLRDPKYKGLYTVFTGFNEAFREYFPGKDPVAEMRALEAKGSITIRPTFRGVLLYKASEAPKTNPTGGDALRKILGK